jgi:threonine dehydrogenase-like Zn-dependent dehydrogenase
MYLDSTRLECLSETTHVELAALTDNEFYDVVFDAPGNASAIEVGFRLAANGGTCVRVNVVKDTI